MSLFKSGHTDLERSMELFIWLCGLWLGWCFTVAEILLETRGQKCGADYAGGGETRAQYPTMQSGIEAIYNKNKGRVRARHLKRRAKLKQIIMGRLACVRSQRRKSQKGRWISNCLFSGGIHCVWWVCAVTAHTLYGPVHVISSHVKWRCRELTGPGAIDPLSQT